MSDDSFRTRVIKLSNPALTDEVRLVGINQLLSENLVAQVMVPVEMLCIVFETPARYWELELGQPLSSELFARHLAYHIASSAGIDGVMQAIHHGFCDAKQLSDPLPGLAQFAIRQSLGRPGANRIKPMQAGGATPGGDQRGPCRLAGCDGGLDAGRVMGKLLLCHQALLSSPRTI